MFDNIYLAGFVAASLIVLVTPGPGVLYVIARTVSQGAPAGFVSVVGLSVGALVHIAAATAGLSAILLASATAFNIVKLVGAGYLVYLGIRTLLEKPAMRQDNHLRPRAYRRVFVDAVLISVLNPKIAVFFFAFLPQFIVSGSAPAPAQIVVLGIVYVQLALVTDSGYVVLAHRLRRFAGSKIARGSVPRIASGGIYIGLGLGTALASRE